MHILVDAKGNGEYIPNDYCELHHFTPLCMLKCVENWINYTYLSPEMYAQVHTALCYLKNHLYHHPKLSVWWIMSGYQKEKHVQF